MTKEVRHLNTAGSWVRFGRPALGAVTSPTGGISYVNNGNGTLTVTGAVNNGDGTLTFSGTGYTNQGNGTLLLT